MKFDTLENTIKKNGLTDLEFYQLVDDMSAYFDSVLTETNLSPVEALHNLHCLECYLLNMSDEAVSALIASEEDLSSFADHPKDLLEQVQKDIATQEGLLDDWLGDGPIKALFGRKMKTAEYLGPALAECEKKLNSLPASYNYKEDWARITSRYLPTVKGFYARARAVDVVAKAISGISNLASFDANKVASALKGTPYWDSTKQMMKGQQDNNFGHVLMMNITRILWLAGTKLMFMTPSGSPAHWGAIGAVIGSTIIKNNMFEYYDPLKEVSTRGWKTVDEYKNAVKTMKGLVDDMNQITDKCKKLLESAKDETEKQNAKDVMEIGKWVTTEAGLLGRGLVTAIKKMNSGFLGAIGKSIAYA